MSEPVFPGGFDEVDVFADVTAGGEVCTAEGFHHVLGHAGAHQSQRLRLPDGRAGGAGRRDGAPSEVN